MLGEDVLWRRRLALDRKLAELRCSRHPRHRWRHRATRCGRRWDCRLGWARGRRWALLGTCDRYRQRDRRSSKGSQEGGASDADGSLVHGVPGESANAQPIRRMQFPRAPVWGILHAWRTHELLQSRDAWATLTHRLHLACWRWCLPLCRSGVAQRSPKPIRVPANRQRPEHQALPRLALEDPIPFSRRFSPSIRRLSISVRCTWARPATRASR